MNELAIFLFSVIGVSLSGVMLPGPLTAATIARGYREQNAGAKIALGHAAVEIPIILLIYLGFAYFLTSPEIKRGVGVAGGLTLIFMGVMLVRMITGKRLDLSSADLPYGSFATGIFMTGGNPYFFLWWATVGSALVLRATDFGALGLALFMVIHWTCDLCWEQFISVSTYRSRHLWTPRVQRVIFGVCATVLIGFGTWFGLSFLG